MKRKILLYVAAKLLVAFGGGMLLFTLLPLSLYVLLLPLDIIGWLLIRSKISASAGISISIMIYLVAVVSSFIWIQTGHTGLEFLLDMDWMR